MASSKLIVNLAFSGILALLGLTAGIALNIKLTRDARPPVAAQDSSNRLSTANASKTGDIEERRASLEKLITQDPQNADYRTQLGNLYYDAGQYNKAIDYYQQSLSIHPQDPNIETDLATCFHYLGQNDRALEILDKVLKYSPDFVHAKFNKGIVLVEGKKDVWEELLRSDPNSPHKKELEERIHLLRTSPK
jgi:tetratricopeptide (TPR) repeat protein